jgi:hypothetical protein
MLASTGMSPRQCSVSPAGMRQIVESSELEKRVVGQGVPEAERLSVEALGEQPGFHVDVGSPSAAHGETIVALGDVQRRLPKKAARRLRCKRPRVQDSRLPMQRSCR